MAKSLFIFLFFLDLLYIRSVGKYHVTSVIYHSHSYIGYHSVILKECKRELHTRINNK